MNEGYLQTKIRSQEDQIREQQNNLNTLRITIESLQRKITKLEEDTRKVTNIDDVVRKLVSLNKEETQKEYDKLKKHLEHYLIAVTDEKLEQYNDVFIKTKKFVNNFVRQYSENDLPAELLNQRCILCALIDLLSYRKTISISELNKALKVRRREAETQKAVVTI